MIKRFKVTVVETVKQEAWLYLDEAMMGDVRVGREGFSEDRWALLSYLRENGGPDCDLIQAELSNGYGELVSHEIADIEEEEEL